MEIAKIGDIAQVMRCQVPRKVFPGDDGNALSEITPEILEGKLFVPEKLARKIWARITDRSNKFLVQPDDILMTAIAIRRKIGSAAFVGGETQAAIPGRNLILVRPDAGKVDPVWLFYRLLQKDVRDKLQAAATGNRISCISNDMVGTLEICLPTQEEIETVRSSHAVLMEDWTAMQKIWEREKLEMEKLAGIFGN